MEEATLAPTERLALILNPVKNGASTAREAVSAYAVIHGLPEPEVYETTVEDPGTGATRRAVADGATQVVAAGGDGTVRAVAAALLDTGVQLGLLPLGTGNLLARNLGIDVDDLETAARTAVLGEARPIDAVRVRTVTPDGAEHEHVGVVAAGVGLDAEIVAGTNDKLKRVVGPLAYVATALGRAAGHRYRVRVCVDHGPWETSKVRTVLLANAGYFQGGIEFAPGALLDDAVLNAVLIKPRSLVGWGALVLKTLWRPSARVPVVSYHEGSTVSVRPLRPLAAQVDGDPVGDVTTLEATVLEHALRVRVPPEQARLAPGGKAPRIAALDQLGALAEQLPPVQRVRHARRQARRRRAGRG